MTDQKSSNSQITQAYRAKTRGSEKLSGEANRVLPSGITHDSRNLRPYALYIEKALGPHKWDVDGNRYIDYSGGHGALLLGHCHPDVTNAVHKAIDAGTQFGANHPKEVEWASQVIKMMPSIEQVRFTSSGTEATLMALRLSRSFTGKNKFIRFKSHYHGWNDHMSSGYINHFDGSPTSGVLKEIARNVILVSPQDISEIKLAIDDCSDIAAVILEPTGSSFGVVPMEEDFLRTIREMTKKKGIILIFDEVITGFRCSPGGAQAVYDIVPDLTAMAKILSGGLPGGAVGGRKEILDELDFKNMDQQGREKVIHLGTFNANPVSASAGIAALKIIERTDACEKANKSAAWLRRRFNEILEEERVSWATYGTFSGLNIFTNTKGTLINPSSFKANRIGFQELICKDKQLVTKFLQAMAVNGVDLSNGPGGKLSATHTQGDLEFTAGAFQESLRMLRSEGEI